MPQDLNHFLPTISLNKPFHWGQHFIFQVFLEQLPKVAGRRGTCHQLWSILVSSLPRESRAMVETGSALLPSPCQEECSFPWKTGKTVTNWHGQWQGGHPRISLKWVLVGDPWLWHEMETFCGRKWRTSLYSQSWILPSGLWYYQQC